jgi:NAD-specific glutamate dehydrogenase
MEDDLFGLRRTLCERALETAGGAPIDEAIEGFLASRAEAVDRLQRFLRTLGLEGVTDLSQLTVALRQIRAVAG